MGWADLAPLDSSYGLARPPVANLKPEWLEFRLRSLLTPKRNDLKRLISFQTPVKHQIRRGICSIFSSVAILESLLKKQKQVELDLSENYLAYVVMSKVQHYASQGSNAVENFLGVRYPGIIDETAWPYEGEDWLDEALSEEESKKREKTCYFEGLRQDMCLKSHLDPNRDPYEKLANSWSEIFKTRNIRAERINNLSKVYQLLLANEPILLEIEFFYGAWNHPRMVDLEIGERDIDQWVKGRVGIPSPDDIFLSQRKPAGHSIVLVGFDQEAKVYFFKNSWGTTGFGRESDLLGPGSTPGYGSIPFEYAHRWGTFLQIVGY